TGTEDNLDFHLSYQVYDADDTTPTPGTLTVTVDDDSPVAVNDTNSVNEGASVNGNVATNDHVGADGTAVSGLVTGVATGSDVSHAVSGNLGSLAGQYGTLHLNTDGTYSYMAGTVSGDVTDHFVYTVTDGDGDTSTTTLDIAIKNVNRVPVGGLTSATIDDEGLPHGIVGGTSDAATNSAAATGFFPGAGGDGALSYNFANLQGSTALIGQETVTYSWDNGSNSLTAKITASTVGGRVGQVLFTVDLNSATGQYQVSLVNPVLHAKANNADGVDITLNLQYSLGDSDADTSTADTGNGTLAITFNDDSPVDFTAQSMTIENGANAIGSGALNFYESIGADGGSVVFAGGTDGLTKLMNGVTTITSGGKEVFLYGYGTDTLTGMIDLDGNGSKETTVFAVKLSPNTISEPNDLYTVQFARALDDGSGTTITDSNLSTTSKRDYKMVNDSTSADQDILISASHSNGSQAAVNGSSSSGYVAFGVDQPTIGTGDLIRFDFAKTVTVTGSANNSFTEGANYNTNGFTFTVQSTAGSGVRVVTYDATKDPNYLNTYTDLTNDSLHKDTITQIYKNGVLLDLGTLTASNGGYIVPSVTGDVISVFTSDGYNRIEVSNTSANSFAISNVGYLHQDVGDPLHLAFNVLATDADGDQSNGSIAVTTVPLTSTITGTASDDLLVAGAGGQILSGLDGNDTLIGGVGADTLNGGAGIDTASYQNSAAGVTVDLTLDGNTTAQTSGGDANGDKLIGIENLVGSNFGDILIGDANANILNGLGGNDRLVGGMGSDTLTGGGGNDTFVFNSPSEGLDHIVDFGAGDQLEFSGAAFGGLPTGQLNSANFESNATGISTQGANTPQFIFDTANSTLYFDADGLGGSSAIAMAKLENGQALTASEIHIA
ncbi:MAG: Ig-like domain-containing protein, partial [Xanthobacteraceae bacterium]